MVEEFSAEREARTVASRYSIYRVFVRWERITWQNIFSFSCFVYNNNRTKGCLGLFTRDVGSIYKNMSQRLKMEQDVQEKERMMIGLTGVLDKDILKRFVRQRFIRKLIANNSSSTIRGFSVILSRVAVQFVEAASDLSALLEYKFIVECANTDGVEEVLRNLWIVNRFCDSWFSLFLFKIFKSIDFRINIFLNFKRNDKFFDFSLRF